MNKHLLNNVSFLNSNGYLQLAHSLHFKKYILVFCFYHHWWHKIIALKFFNDM